MSTSLHLPFKATPILLASVTRPLIDREWLPVRVAQGLPAPHVILDTRNNEAWLSAAQAPMAAARMCLAETMGPNVRNVVTGIRDTVVDVYAELAIYAYEGIPISHAAINFTHGWAAVSTYDVDRALRTVRSALIGLDYPDHGIAHADAEAAFRA